jgi:alpha-D-xyloside xylohydrolase
MLYQDISEPKIEVRLDDDSEKYTITTSRLCLIIYKNRFRIEVFDFQGNLITESGGQTKDEFPTPYDSFPLGFIKDKASHRTYGVESFVLYPGEAVYGLGEHFKPVNKVGQSVGLWNFEGLGNTSGRVYKNIPFFMSSQGYGVFINESRPITFWVGSRETCKNQFAVEGDLLDYFFFFGPSFKTILNAYTDLTGKPHLPPMWSFGTWMSRISYFSQEQVSAVMHKLREMKFPCDVIHIDTGWFEKDWQCDWRFDPKRFPDPEAMFRQAHEMGFRICLWQLPYVLDETDRYPEAKKKGILARNNAPFAFLAMFPAHVIDFSNPDGVDWYQGLLASLLDLGADTIKTDFGEQVEPPMKFQKYDGRQMHNLFPLLYQKAAFEIIQKKKGSDNAVIWARSAYAGAQRYPVHWSGDNSSNYENLLSSLRGGLSLGLCGFTFWSQDTGGFVGVPAEEVYIRWVELSIFQSHMRFHGNPPQYKEPWNFSKETQDIVRRYLDLRYRLIPYLFSEAKVAAENGLPLLRHLVIEYQDDPTVFNIEDQFLCGRNLLIAPMLTKNDCRKVYLPQGTWYDFWTGERYMGRQWITVVAGLEKIPVFVRGGTVLPLAQAVQCTNELSCKDLTMRVYPDGTGQAALDFYTGSGSYQLSTQVEGRTMQNKCEPELPMITWELAESDS